MNAQTPAVVIEHEPAREVTPLSLLSQALAKGADMGTLEKFMDLQERHERNQARKAFDAAIAEAKADIKVIEKDATGHNNRRYATFAAYAKAIDPVLSRHGLSYRFRSAQDDRVHVTCILSHREGHSEENTLAGPPDTSGNKNAIQAIGSTLTYLQRYSLVQALGLAAGEDDDGNAASAVAGTIGDDQVEELRQKIVRTGTDLRKFLARFVVDGLEDLTPAQAQRANVLLDAKLAAEAKAEETEAAA